MNRECYIPVLFKNYEKITIISKNPNFSIVVPGACNAKCKFCFWKEDLSMKYMDEYFETLDSNLIDLPKEFNQCSITGGEPTASKYLIKILERARNKFKKVVLSSNGYKIEEEIFKYIDHLNISRHHYEESENYKIFNTKSVPSDERLKEICRMANFNNVDVTLNCVLLKDFNDINFIYDYISFAKNIGANAVCFRKEHGDLYDLPVEKYINEKIIASGGCPVCKSKLRIINGINTTWRYSLLSPDKSIKKNEIYELIFNQNYKLTSDWEQNNLITIDYRIRKEYETRPESCGNHSCPEFGPEKNFREKFYDKVENLTTNYIVKSRRKRVELDRKLVELEKLLKE